MVNVLGDIGRVIGKEIVFFVFSLEFEEKIFKDFFSFIME